MIFPEGLIFIWSIFSQEVQAAKTDSGFPKTFSGENLIVFVEYLCNRSPEMRTKHSKNYISILAIINNWNWLDASPP